MTYGGLQATKLEDGRDSKRSNSRMVGYDIFMCSKKEGGTKKSVKIDG